MSEDAMADEKAGPEDVARLAKIGSEEMTNRVGKMLRQAESLPEGSPEREAFMEKALTLSQAYTIDLAIARASQAKKERVEEVEERNFKVSDYKRGKIASGTKHFTELMMAICDANDIKYLLSMNGMWVFARGFPSDLDMAERLFAILSVEMVTSADAALRRGDHKEKKLVPVTVREEIPFEERDWGGYDPKSQRFYDDMEHWLDYDGNPREGGNVPREVYSWSMNNGQGGYRKPFPPPAFRDVPVTYPDGTPKREEKVVSSVDGRVWRANFYQSFINGIRQRLREAKKHALRDAGIDMADESSSGALALRDKKQEVKDAHEKHVLETEEKRGRKMRSYEGAEVSRYSHTAHEKGQDAAERARLGDEKDVDRSSKREIGR